jgi:hypothetical protein
VLECDEEDGRQTLEGTKERAQKKKQQQLENHKTEDRRQN